MVVIKQNNSLKDKNIFIDKYDIYYDVFDNEKNIGYGAISRDSDNMIYIYIKEGYRGYNFGKYVFDKMLEELLKCGINKVNIIIEGNNVQMKRIISHKKNILKFSNSSFEMYELMI